jgi:anti-sigma regulatory factor (Ser/Thr protein kinase)
MAVATASLEITDRSAIAEARRLTARLVATLDFSEEAAGRAAIVVTELVTNALTHGRGGWCFLNARIIYGEAALEVVVADSGPGIENPGIALADGFSTSGTAGTGLGAVRRLSRDFDLYSRGDGGVVALARVSPDSAGRRPHPGGVGRTEVAGVGAPVAGEQVSGDAWAVDSHSNRTMIMVVDGLGHGPDAAAAAAAAVASFASSGGRALAERLQLLHEALRSTRGAAAAIAEIDEVQMELSYSGIGNIAGRILSDGRVQSLVSMNGTAGGTSRSLREFRYPFPPGSLLIMHSDGIASRWDFDRYPGALSKDTAVIAALVFRDHLRRRDDATVVALRAPLPPGTPNPS